MFNILSMNDNIALDVIRTIAAVFDKAIYWLISFAYNIILEIANIQIFSDAEIQSFAGRLYTLIGIFMLFKLSFSIISYIISPDTIFDKEKGGTKLLKNVVITFILIIIMPTVFNIMGKVQNAILNDNIIENFVLGTDGETSSKMFKIDEQCPVGNKIDNDGDYVALMIFRPFYQVDPNGRNPSDLLAGDYCSATSVPALLKYDIYNSPVAGAIGTGMSGNYNVDYWFIISAIIGGVVFVVLIGFAMDIAVRSIKLSFLQIISPIPIISYIDPNQSKNGIFKKWAKEVGKTWADLFIKLIALYFLLKLLTMIDSLSNITENSDYKLWVSILIIIGGLIFAKKLPTLIGNMLGIKLDGGFNINPLKKLEKEALGGKFLSKLPGKALTAIGGGALGATGAVIGHNWTKSKFNKDMTAQDKKYNEFKSKQAEKLSQAQTLAERQNIIRQTMQEAVKLKSEVNAKKAKIQEDYNEKFSNVHPIAAGIMETLRGTKLGFSKEVKKPTDIITNSINAAKMAAEDKNRHDIFTISRNFEDMISDIAGVKNESGTTSLYKQELKQTNEKLKDIGNYIAQLNHSIAGMMQKAPGAFTFEKNEKGEMIQKTVDGFDYQTALGMSRQDVDRIITELRNLRTEEKLGNKRVNELNEAMKKSKDK